MNRDELAFILVQNRSTRHINLENTVLKISLAFTLTDFLTHIKTARARTHRALLAHVTAFGIFRRRVNLLFFNYAAILAWRLGIRTLVGGMCDTDYSGYPDCRDNTLKSLQVTLSLGLGRDFVIETPLMHLTKAQSWMLAENLGGKALVDLIRFETETCYEGDRTHRHDWGYGCGVCPACRLRAKGWEEFVRSCGK